MEAEAIAGRTAAKALSTVYSQNVFPFMKVTWGTHPNNLGHNDYPGCFRCHDGSHNTKDGSKSIDNDCTVCHNLLAVDEANPSSSPTSDCNNAESHCKVRTISTA